MEKIVKKTFMGILFAQLAFISSAICMENNNEKDDAESEIASVILSLSPGLTGDNNNTVLNVTKTVSTKKTSNKSNISTVCHCKTCERSFKSLQERDQHRKFAHDEGRVPCPICFKTYANIDRLNKHKCGFKKDSKNPHQYKRFIKISTKPKERVYRCIYCNQPYAKQNSLEKHEVECDGTLHKRMVTQTNITQTNITQTNKRKAEYVGNVFKKVRIEPKNHFDFNNYQKNTIKKYVPILKKPI